jgi:hypothetical protein
VTVKVNAAPPAVALAGAMEVIVGVVGGVGDITKLTVGDVPPPDPEFTTVTDAEPAVATSVAVIWACSEFPLRTIVVRDLPFQFNVAPDAKLAPLTDSVNAAAPAITLTGEIEQITGVLVDDTVKLSEGE